MMSAESSPKLVIVDESPIRAAILEEGLREAGFPGVVHISEMQSLLSRIYALGIHQRLGAPKRNKADLGRSGLLHI
jgi:hypothetical protein